MSEPPHGPKDSSAGDLPDLDVWTIPGVDGQQLTFVLNGEVCILLTGDSETVYVDEIFARISIGRPIEMTQAQLLEFCRFVIRRLDPEGRTQP